MILVPRQLRRSDFPSSVPYYGGRLTPGHIQGLQARPELRPPLPPPAPAPAPAAPDPAQSRATLDDLRASGVVTDAEYDEIRRRIDGPG
jgi:hypothetical protein